MKSLNDKLFWRGLFTGDFRHWSHFHYKKYHKALGFREMVGIEVEMLRSPKIEKYVTKLTNNWTYDDKFQWVNSNGGRYDEIEIAKLWKCSNPIIFSKTLKEDILSVGRKGVYFAGSVHSNYNQIPKVSWDPKINYLGHSYVREGYDNTERIEVKNTPSFINWEDLLIFLIAKSSHLKDIVFNGSNETDGELINRIENSKVISEYYPKSKVEFSIFS